MIPEYLQIEAFESVMVESAFPLGDDSAEYSITFDTNRHPGILIGKSIFLASGGLLKVEGFYRHEEGQYFVCTAVFVPKR